MFIQVRTFQTVEYPVLFDAMKAFTESRGEACADEIWVCEHKPVFTQGLAGDPAHLLQRNNIPVIQTDRGGQITYHGPGQVVVYPLLDLRRYGLKVREYVALLEQAIIDTLVQAGVADAQRKPGAPGVYTWHNRSLAKIAALGIKIRKGCSYHGLSVNVNMDLSPFLWINPCGYAGLETVDLKSVGVKISMDEIKIHLVKNLIQKLDIAHAAVSQSR